MSKTRIPETLRRLIVEQFQSRCAYCQTQQQISGVRLTVDHIIPEAFGGKTAENNLAWPAGIATCTKPLELLCLMTFLKKQFASFILRINVGANTLAGVLMARW